ncbi:hypothetical protein BFP97_01055 [Roseivirga sp. 4D4]|uniref:nuclear transport factor 2 family protein n=1 Tax=Roseivirga sp. 4D4 TaxID=1889784 RepID=UPI000853DBB1|nr:nuclear transport factor 2 family protein [Roseivirga sp. 4D4]OEK00187.1 hypothetical protein BFP97_01055 [Roseivirga sp. 4D4]
MFKNSNTIKHTTQSFIALLLLVSTVARGQSIYDQPEQLKEAILENDDQFWKAYNQCNVDQMVSFLTEDLEFYHDKNGLTKGLADFKKALSEGLCANGPQLRRQVKEGSVEVFPLKGIGAIISGEHYFYVGDRADALAKFTHIWNFENGAWKMSRVLSYDHQPVPYENQKTAISLSDKLLASYAGNYLAPQTGKVVFSKLEGKLQMAAGPMELILIPEKENLFFHEQSSLTFEFISNENSEVTKVIIRENGQIVEEAKRNN